MKYEKIATTDLTVSRICLGSMTWGEQNSREEAFAQLDFALDRGVNFVDTAELYAVPPRPETYGRTEEIIGDWFAATGRRDQVVLATKVAGPARDLSYIRNGSRLTPEHVSRAVEGSLKRLRTDYIDIYQTHWPERGVPVFGRTIYESNEQPEDATLEITLRAMDDLIRDGKIRYVGISNETPWGMMEHLRLAREMNLPRAVSVQNVYSLLNRTYEFGCAEVGERERLGLLAYSPLAFGVLTGKYLHGKRPEGARITVFKRFQRYTTHAAENAVLKYQKIARKFGLDLTGMALAFVNSRPFVLSNIIGATRLEQLATNIDSIDLELDPEVIGEINQVHDQRHNPCP